MSWGAIHGDDDVGVAVYTARDVGAVSAEDAADDKLAETHAYGVVDKERTTARFIDEEENHGGEDDEKGVL